jgi:hypothetical protein
VKLFHPLVFSDTIIWQSKYEIIAKASWHKGDKMRKKNRMKLKKAEEILAREKQRQRNVFLNIATALTLTTLVGLSVIALAPVRKDEAVSSELESESR